MSEKSWSFISLIASLILMYFVCYYNNNAQYICTECPTIGLDVVAIESVKPGDFQLRTKNDVIELKDVIVMLGVTNYTRQQCKIWERWINREKDWWVVLTLKSGKFTQAQFYEIR